MTNIADPPLRVDHETNLVSGIATGWAFSEDRKTITLSLSKGLKFHDGTPITPKDVLISLRRSLSSPYMLHTEIYKSLVSTQVEEAITLNDSRIEIKLKHPLNALLYNLSFPEMGIAPPEYGKGNNFKESMTNLSGPYSVKSFRSDKLQLKKHNGHPLAHQDAPESVNIIEISDLEDKISYYKQNDNVLLVAASYDEALAYSKLPGEKYESAFNLTTLLLPNIDSPKLNTVEKRRHIFSTIKKAFAQVHIDERYAERTNQIFTKNNVARLKENRPRSLYHRDTGELPESISLIMFDATKDNPIPEGLKKALKDQGIELAIERPGNKKALKRIDEGDYELLFLYNGVSAPDPIMELIYSFSLPILKFAYKNQASVEILNQAKQETNQENYISMLKEIHWRLLRDYRALPLIHTRMLYCAKGDYALPKQSYFDGSFNLWDWRLKK